MVRIVVLEVKDWHWSGPVVSTLTLCAQLKGGIKVLSIFNGNLLDLKLPEMFFIDSKTNVWRKHGKFHFGKTNSLALLHLMHVDTLTHSLQYWLYSVSLSENLLSGRAESMRLVSMLDWIKDQVKVRFLCVLENWYRFRNILLMSCDMVWTKTLAHVLLLETNSELGTDVYIW